MNVKRSKPYFLCWNFLPVHVTRGECGTAAQVIMDRRRGLILFRNGHGFQMEFSGNKGGCRSDAPGAPRHTSGTNLAKFSFRETLVSTRSSRLSHVCHLKSGKITINSPKPYSERTLHVPREHNIFASCSAPLRLCVRPSFLN